MQIILGKISLPPIGKPRGFGSGGVQLWQFAEKLWLVSTEKTSDTIETNTNCLMS